MEPAKKLISQPLLELLCTWGKTDESVSDERVCAKHLHKWPNFAQDIQNTLQTLKLAGNVPTESGGLTLSRLQ